MARSVPEWIAKHDDQSIPPRVRTRVFEKYNGVCQISKRKIQPGDKWELNHKVELIVGGEHRESNLEPVLVKPHKEETKCQMAVKKKVNRTKKKHLGIKANKPKIQSKGFTKYEKTKKIDKAAIDAAALPSSGGLARQYGISK